MTTSEKKEITIDEILKDVNIQNEICKDLLKDKKRNERNLLLFFVFIVAVLISLFIYFDYSNKCFMSTLDFKDISTDVTNNTDLKTGGNGAITDINKVNISK